ncbi:hypothetical protein E2P81_ATG09229 [Venturia nashicola]|uniref:Uncharacterized protein n=1 Tax=Venturia nashicola TaxID=86259 RepID=A0A4Z1NNR1_9PEZI|nr:hypothetical protein E6O75_ATG09432 [Venturia nashicola]TLD20159.1 hypothetical protein E2P81_ATG09229 [Venturia nashicola]
MLFIITLLLLTVGQTCVAIDSRWVSPGPYVPSSSQKSIWFEREIKELIWTTDMVEYGIFLTQGKPAEHNSWVCIFRKNKNDDRQSRMLWTVQTFTFQLRVSNSFYLQINDGNHHSSLTNSFIIKNATQNSTNTCPQSNTTTALRESCPPLSDDKARSVGIGLGVGLGVPLLAALASLAFLLTSFRRIDKDEVQDTKIGVVTAMEEPRKDFYYHHEASNQHEIYEIPNDDAIHEAPEGNA